MLFLTANLKAIFQNVFGSQDAEKVEKKLDVKYTLIDVVQATTADASTDFDGIVKEGDTIIQIGDSTAEKTTAAQDDAVNIAATVGDIYWIYREL